MSLLERIVKVLPIIDDFPEKGIRFVNIFPLFKDTELRNKVLNVLTEKVKHEPFNVILGVESRGYLFGLPLAERLKVPFVCARKPNKLPGKLVRVDYKMEYGNGKKLELEMEVNAIKKGDRVLIVDDILATGGTILAASELVQMCGGEVVASACLLDIKNLDGRNNLKSTCHLLFSFDGNTFTNVVEEEEEKLVRSDNKNYLHIPEKIILLAHSSMESIARKLVNMYDDIFCYLPIKWKSFPDGFPDIKFPNCLKGTNVVFLANLADKDSYMDQLSVMRVLPRQLITSLQIFLPYFAPGTMERVEEPGILATADTYATITSRGFPSTRTGPPILNVYDLHNPVSRFPFSDDVCFQPMSMLHDILEEVSLMFKGSKDGFIVAFPDDGSYKRFRKIVGGYNEKIPIIICGKLRNGEERKVFIVDRAPSNLEIKGKNVIIIDDLVQTGGTLHECHVLIRNEGARSVSAYVTHAVFPNREFMHFYSDGKYKGLDNFFITDTNPSVSKLLRDKKPFRVISTVNSIAKETLSALKYEARRSIDINVCSKSSIKTQAVGAAFSKLFPLDCIMLHEYNCSSRVPPQPLGLEQTKKGAYGRMQSLIKDEDSDNDSTFVVSIENGFDPDTLTDFAYIVINHNGIIHEGVSSGVVVPQEVYDEFLVEKYDTIGDVYAKRGFSKDNWHVEVGGVSRHWLIQQAIIRILRA